MERSNDEPANGMKNSNWLFAFAAGIGAFLTWALTAVGGLGDLLRAQENLKVVSASRAFSPEVKFSDWLTPTPREVSEYERIFQASDFRFTFEVFNDSNRASTITDVSVSVLESDANLDIDPFVMGDFALDGEARSVSSTVKIEPDQVSDFSVDLWLLYKIRNAHCAEIEQIFVPVKTNNGFEFEEAVRACSPELDAANRQAPKIEFVFETARGGRFVSLIELQTDDFWSGLP